MKEKKELKKVYKIKNEKVAKKMYAQQLVRRKRNQLKQELIIINKKKS